jgi:hypothetical protein
MPIATQALMIEAGLLLPLLIAVVASPKALKRLGAWAIARAVALEDARMHYAMTRAAEHAILSQQYAIGGKSRKDSEDTWKRLNA